MLLEGRQGPSLGTAAPSSTWRPAVLVQGRRSSAATEATTTAQHRPDTRVHIPRTRIHGLIRGAKEHFENSRPVDDGAYLKPYKKLLVDVTASKACLDKALDFANDLFNAFESVGHRVAIAPSDEPFRRAAIDEREVRKRQRNPYYRGGLWSPYRPTIVYLGSVAIGLAIVEMSEEVLLRYLRGKYIRDADYIPPKPSRHVVDHTWTTTQEIPSGRLRLVAYSPYWRIDWAAEVAGDEEGIPSLRREIRRQIGRGRGCRPRRQAGRSRSEGRDRSPGMACR